LSFLSFLSVTDQLAVYVHLPWCVQKCPYCDFNSHALKQPLSELTYVQAVLTDLSDQLSVLKGRQLNSIFFGGGTPSLFSGDAIGKLIDSIYQQLDIQHPVEVTLEANPGTVDAVNFHDYIDVGVNRISLGVQSFDTDALVRLGRIHNAKAAIQAFQLARRVGFTNINIDLMFGLPQQTLTEGLSDLQQAIELEPEHISWYQLTLEPHTPFYRQPPLLPSHDEIYALYQQGRDLLKRAGYEAYEVSAYAKPGYPCQHNVNYWRYGDYVGVGAGAHGKITQQQPWQLLRTRKQAHPNAYLRDPKAFAAHDSVLAEEMTFEYMLNHLRLVQPVDFAHFEAYTQQNRESLITRAADALERDLLTLTPTHLALTEQGRLFLDDVVALFLPEST